MANLYGKAIEKKKDAVSPTSTLLYLAGGSIYFYVNTEIVEVS